MDTGEENWAREVPPTCPFSPHCFLSPPRNFQGDFYLTRGGWKPDLGHPSPRSEGAFTRAAWALSTSGRGKQGKCPLSAWVRAGVVAELDLAAWPSSQAGLLQDRIGLSWGPCLGVAPPWPVLSTQHLLQGASPTCTWRLGASSSRRLASWIFLPLFPLNSPALPVSRSHSPSSPARGACGCCQ